MDGRIARALKGQSRFGAELDSLSDVIAFGVSPAIILYLWSLQNVPRFGWIFALAYAVCAALRLARFNAAIDVEEQPHKSAGFLTGVPAPAGRGCCCCRSICGSRATSSGTGCATSRSSRPGRRSSPS